MHDCLFCKILRREIPSYPVYEDADTYAFLDIRPVHLGHVLVIPKQHVATLLDADEKIAQQWIVAVQRVARHLSETLAIEGFNLMQNNGKIAGQVVEHLHMHIIPRHADDGLEPWPQLVHPTPQQLQALSEQIRF